MTYKLSVVCVRAAPSSVQDTARQDSLDASDGPALTAASSEALPGALSPVAAGDARLSGPCRAGSAPSALPPLPKKDSGSAGSPGSSGGRRGSGPGWGSGGQRASGGGGTPTGSGEPGRQVPGISAGSGGGGGGAGMVDVVSPQTVLPPGWVARCLLLAPPALLRCAAGRRRLWLPARRPAVLAPGAACCYTS